MVGCGQANIRAKRAPSMPQKVVGLDGMMIVHQKPSWLECKMPLMPLGASLAHNFQELIIGSDASVNGHVLRYVQLLLPHILIERPHRDCWSGRRRALRWRRVEVGVDQNLFLREISNQH